MSVKSIVLIIVIGSSLAAPVAANEALLSKALSAYDAGNFAEAAEVYAELAADHRNADVFFNLGNALFKAGERGKAVAAYLCARDLAPRDPDVAANLAFVSKDSRDNLAPAIAIPAALGFFRFFERFNSKELVYTATILFVVGVALLGAWGRRALWPGLVALALALLVMFGCFYRLKTTGHWGAVSVPETGVYADPSEQVGPMLFKLHEGAPVWVAAVNGDWLRIALSDGKEGWVAKASVKTFPCTH